MEEFFLMYPSASNFSLSIHRDGAALWIANVYTRKKIVKIEVTHEDPRAIQAVLGFFQRHETACHVEPEPDPLKVFIGHGRDTQWRELKDHLTEQHGIEVEAYEVGPRAGMSVKDVLEKMLNRSTFAFIVLTGEDEHADGQLHARENVIHELGLFQGKLGFLKAIAILEEGVKEFSNILGVNQIRFGRGNIRSTFGDVLATLKRESADSQSRHVGA